MNKPIYLSQAILDISKTLMYEFWYDYIKPKNKVKARLGYMDTVSLIINIKTERLIGTFKDELDGKIMTELCVLRAKAYAYPLDDDTEMKKGKGTKKCRAKRELTFKNYMDYLFNNEVITKSQQRFRSYYNRVYTKEADKISLCSNNDKRLHMYDRIAGYPYGTPAIKVCELDILLNEKAKRLLYTID